MARPQKYSDEDILNKLRTHLIDEYGSVYTMHSPTWEGIKKRMAKDENLKELVEDIVAEANFVWEKMGITALLTGDETFNVQLFKIYTQNKKSFLSHEILELEERLKRIEDAQADKTN